jgi:predicted RND superfamily exporter protein
VASYGLGAYAGIIFSSLMNVLPFIMAGIGVDAMFVLQSALDRTSPDDNMEDRMAYTFSHAGVSVTLASLTNFGSFLISSNTTLPALHGFALYTAFALLFDLILQVCICHCAVPALPQCSVATWHICHAAALTA